MKEKKVTTKKPKAKTKTVVKKTSVKAIAKKTNTKPISKKPVVKKAVVREATLMKAKPEKEEKKTKALKENNQFKDFIKASIIVFFSLILLITLFIFFTFSLVRLGGELYLRQNLGDNKEPQIETVKDLSDYIYHGEKKDELDKDSFQTNTLNPNLPLESERFMSLGESGLEETIRTVASPDGLKLAIVVKKGGQEAVMLNGELGPFYESISFMLFSPNSQRFAYGVKNDYQQFVVLDDKEGKIYDWVFPPLAFSPDSKYFIYKSRNSQGHILVFNEEESEVYDYIFEPFVKDDKSALIFYSRRGNQFYKNSLELW